MRLNVPPSRRVQVAQNIRTDWAKSDLRPNEVTSTRKEDRGDRQFVNDEMTASRLDPPGRKDDREPNPTQYVMRGQRRDFNERGELLNEASNLSRGSPKQDRIMTRSEFDAWVGSVLMRQVVRQIRQPKP